MRLIDADALLTSVYRKYGPIAALEDIQNAPTVEAEPVRHGKWHDTSYSDIMCYCSACHETFVLFEGSPRDNLYNYCPNCGARMDEEAEQ